MRVVSYLLGPNFGLFILLIIKLYILAYSHFFQDFLSEKIAHRDVTWRFFFEVQKEAKILQKAWKNLNINAFSIFVVNFLHNL